jgi:uncharacterized metal-binding protein
MAIDCKLSSRRVTGVAFCTVIMAIAVIQTAGINANKSLTIGPKKVAKRSTL